MAMHNPFAKMALPSAALALVMSSAAVAEVESRFLLGVAGFESHCFLPVLSGEKPSPDLKSVGADEWRLSSGVVLKTIESSKGQFGCQVQPSAGQRVDKETLAALNENFGSWAETITQANAMREYQACEAFGDGTRRVLDTTPKLNGETVRVVFETRPELSHFVIIAAQTSVLTPPADCEPWES